MVLKVCAKKRIMCDDRFGLTIAMNKIFTSHRAEARGDETVTVFLFSYLQLPNDTFCVLIFFVYNYLHLSICALVDKELIK